MIDICITNLQRARQGNDQLPTEQWPDDEPLELEDLILEIQTAPDAPAGVAALPVEITPASEDPPAPASRGEAERAPDAIATGCCGFTHQQSTVWDAFAGRPDCANDTTDFLQQLEIEPRLRSAAMLRTLGRVREGLEAMPEQSALDARVCVSLQDALVLISQVMNRIR